MSIRCPKCGSEKVQYVTSTNSKGPSMSKGCCGWIIFGPVGMLCSLCGSGSTTRKYWVCHNCGCEFQKEDYERSEFGKEDCENSPQVLKQAIANLNTEISKMQSDYASYVDYFDLKAPDNWADRYEETSILLQEKRQKLNEAEKNYLESNQDLKRLHKIKNLVYVLSVFAAIAVPFIFTEVLFWLLPGALLIGLVYNMHKYYHLVYDSKNPEELKNIKVLREEYEIASSTWQSYNEIKNKYETMNKLPEQILIKQKAVENLQQRLDKSQGKNKDE